MLAGLFAGMVVFLVLLVRVLFFSRCSSVISSMLGGKLVFIRCMYSSISLWGSPVSRAACWIFLFSGFILPLLSTVILFVVGV